MGGYKTVFVKFQTVSHLFHRNESFLVHLYLHAVVSSRSGFLCMRLYKKHASMSL